MPEDLMPQAPTDFPKARIVWVAFLGMICASAIAAPFLAAHGCSFSAAILYLAFSRVCHQISERSCHLWGQSCAVCHRCCGIYLGLFLASFFPVRRLSWMHLPDARRLWVIGASAPLLADAILPYAGIWSNAAGTRFATGFLFGVMLSSLVTAALLERSHGQAHPGLHISDS